LGMPPKIPAASPGGPVRFAETAEECRARAATAGLLGQRARSFTLRVYFEGRAAVWLARAELLEILHASSRTRPDRKSGRTIADVFAIPPRPGSRSSRSAFRSPRLKEIVHG
jgi:hypothetical protein